MCGYNPPDISQGAVPRAPGGKERRLDYRLRGQHRLQRGLFPVEISRCRIDRHRADEGNCRLLRKNLEPFGERARVRQAAIWSRDQRLRIDRGQFGDGEEWSYQVRVCRDDEQADVSAIGLKTIIKQFNWEQVDVLKIDVEGAELELFASGYVPWLSRTSNLAIELHDQDCEQVFLRAMTGYHCQRRQSGETTICRNIRARP
jgi:FkbM family methyltransferase